jgi:hypothetical protein
MTCTRVQHHPQDQDIGDPDTHKQRSTLAVQYMEQYGIQVDPATDDQHLTDFSNALVDLHEELAATHRAQLAGTVNLLVGKPEHQGRPLADLRAEAKRAVAADQRRVLAFELPELVHETPDQLAQAMQASDDELKRRLEAALDLAAQAPPSFRRFRDEARERLARARRNQTGIASLHNLAIAARRSAEQQAAGTTRRPRQVRRQLAQLNRVQQSTGNEGDANLRRIRHLQARLEVLDTVEARRQEWAVEDPGRSAVLALGCAAAETLMERKLAPRFTRFTGTTDPEAPTEPFPVLAVVTSGEEG